MDIWTSEDFNDSFPQGGIYNESFTIILELSNCVQMDFDFWLQIKIQSPSVLKSRF